MEAVLVPPSASKTSQSTVNEYPFIIPKLQTALKDLPINLEISLDLPDSNDFLEILLPEDPGYILYSAVTHPLSEFSSQSGSRVDIDTVTKTFVLPDSYSTEFSAELIKFFVTLIGLIKGTSFQFSKKYLLVCN